MNYKLNRNSVCILETNLTNKMHYGKTAWQSNISADYKRIRLMIFFFR